MTHRWTVTLHCLSKSGRSPKKSNSALIADKCARASTSGQQSDCSSKTKINYSFYLYFRKKCQKSGQNQRQKQLFSVEYTGIKFGARVHEPWEISGNLGILRL